jgi:hypothetical protein
MGDTGLEPVDVTTCQNKELQKLVIQSGAESGALGAQCDNLLASLLADPDLGYIVNQWPLLPQVVRAAVIELIRQGLDY